MTEVGESGDRYLEMAFSKRNGNADWVRVVKEGEGTAEAYRVKSTGEPSGKVEIVNSLIDDGIQRRLGTCFGDF